MRTILATLLLIFSALTYSTTAAADSLDKLLDQVKSVQSSEAEENRQRENRFNSSKKQLESDVKTAKKERRDLIKKSESLEARHSRNEKILTEEQARLDRRLGSLKELFGIIQQVSTDTKGNLDNSIINTQYPGRTEFLEELSQKMGTSSELASIAEIEQLWFEIQREMTESAKVVRFQSEIIDKNGEQKEAEIIRVGTFNLIADGQYLQYIPITQKIVELAKQPDERYRFAAARLDDAPENQLANFAIDPTGGSVLSILLKEPTLSERLEYGGKTGLVLLFLGIVSFLLSMERILTLAITRTKIYQQAQRLNQLDMKNPLGRVLSVYDPKQKIDTETLELKLGEAILKEGPRVERFIPLLKIIAVIAPLLGLFGTVVGMIITFQDITLHGTGDPRTMASGISQALITTVMGMLVAIPTIVMHSVANSIAKSILQILQEQSAGILSLNIEQQRKNQNQASEAP